MPEEKDEGGNIYPQHTGCITTDMKGITRRDWLAGLAMQGMMANIDDKGASDMAKEFKAIPNLAYTMADNMIAESNK